MLAVTAFRVIVVVGLACAVAAFGFVPSSTRISIPRYSSTMSLKATRTLEDIGLGDFVKVSLRVRNPDEGGQDALAPDAIPFDQGDVSFVINGGFSADFGRQLHASAASLTSPGQSASASLAGPPYNAQLAADLPYSSCPPGLKVGDNVRLSNGMKCRVASVVEGVSVRIDANPRLAGQMLTADITLIERLPLSYLHVATFACGCFWGLELALQRVHGVAMTAPGYTHGTVDSPSYEAVCSGSTGHAEAVVCMYDPSVTTYEQLLEVFWSRHDPTQLNRQGNDVGTQYRGGIYYHSEAQRQIAEDSMRQVQTRYVGKPLATELKPATTFWVAEEYHQQYLEKGGQSAKKTATEQIRCYG
jgi:methionine-S-sulfoxide reductase